MSIVNRVVDEVFVVNMDSQKDRMDRVDSILKHHGIRYTRFSAVKGAAIGYSDHLTPFCNKFCPDGLKGCALSHRGIWKTMVEKNISSALVLEDDIQLDPVFFESFLNGWNAIPKNYDIVWLGCHTVNDDNLFARTVSMALSKKVEPLNEYIVKSSCGFGTYGYIITKSCAERFLTKKIPFHIDHTMGKWIEDDNLNSYIFQDTPINPNNDFHTQSTIADTYPKGLNTLLKRIPTSSATQMDWTLGESWLKVGPFIVNPLLILITLIVLATPREYIPYYFIWILVEYLLSFDMKNTVKYAILIGGIYGAKTALSTPKKLRFI